MVTYFWGRPMIDTHISQCHQRIAMVLCGIVVFSCSVLVHADESESLKQRFFQEAPRAWEEYGAYAQRLQGTAKRTITIDGKIHSIMHVEWKSNPRCKMALAQELLARDPIGEVFVFNARYGFNLKRKNSDAPWILTELQVGASHVGPKGWDEFPALRLCINAHLYELPELIRLPNFRVVGVRTVQQDGLELCQIQFGSKQADGILLLDPHRFWVLRQSSISEKNSDQVITAKQEIELRNPTAKYPIPKHWLLSKEFSNGPNGGKSDARVVEEFDVKELSAPPDDSEFTLTAFGLPEPMGIPTPAKSHAYLWIALAAVGAVTLAVLFRWMALRSRKA